MNTEHTPSRARFLLMAGAWIVLIATAEIAMPLALRDRLPDPMASHWRGSGVPNSSVPFALAVSIPVAVWLAIAAGCLVSGVQRRPLRRSVSRGWITAVLGWGGLFTLGLQTVSVFANLDRRRWQDASLPAWQVVTVVVVSLAAGLIFRAVGRRGGDARSSAAEPLVIDLPAGRRTVWVSSVSAPYAVTAGTAALVAAVVLAVAAALDLLSRHAWVVAGVLAAVGLAGLALSTIAVKVSAEGLRLAFGPFRWPARRVPLGRIERAWVEERYPSEVGGWGYRGLPGMATIMIRGGECLVVRYVSGGQLAISVDDATTGAALLNALVSAPRP